MYLITTYGNWNYECYAYDLDTVPTREWQKAVQVIIDSAEDICTIHNGLEADPKADYFTHKKPEKLYTWNHVDEEWKQNFDYKRE